jgi:hypothetical protein
VAEAVSIPCRKAIKVLDHDILFAAAVKDELEVVTSCVFPFSGGFG